MFVRTLPLISPRFEIWFPWTRFDNIKDDPGASTSKNKCGLDFLDPRLDANDDKSINSV